MVGKGGLSLQAQEDRQLLEGFLADVFQVLTDRGVKFCELQAVCL